MSQNGHGLRRAFPTRAKHAELFRRGKKLGEICFSTNKTRRNFRARENLVEFSGAGQKLGEFFPRGKNSSSFCPAPENSAEFFPRRLIRRVFPRPKQIPPSLSTPEKTRRAFPGSVAILAQAAPRCRHYFPGPLAVQWTCPGGSSPWPANSPPHKRRPSRSLVPGSAGQPVLTHSYKHMLILINI